jgi:hypothetical protein
MIARLWRDLSQLVRSWYMHDRIRASPVEGRLLRVQPGDLLTVGSRDVIVVDRSVAEGPAGLCVRLICRTETGIGELHLTMADLETLHLIWIEAGHRCPMAAVDVQVWPRNRKIGNDTSRPMANKPITPWNL